MILTREECKLLVRGIVWADAKQPGNLVELEAVWERIEAEANREPTPLAPNLYRAHDGITRERPRVFTRGMHVRQSSKPPKGKYSPPPLFDFSADYQPPDTRNPPSDKPAKAEYFIYGVVLSGTADRAYVDWEPSDFLPEYRDWAPNNLLTFVTDEEWERRYAN